MRLAGALALACLTALPASAQGPCRLALQLALDVSGSVDAREYRLQLDGLAWALEDPDVRGAILSVPSAPVAISVFEWSGRDYQHLLVDWRMLLSDADITAVAGRLRATARRPAAVSTAIGAALLEGHARLAGGPACARQVVDISGDGRSNDGPRPQDVQGALGPEQVNALVIGQAPGAAVGAMAGETGELEAYFRHTVIRGPGAFVELAQGYDEFAETMKRKLLRELQVDIMGESPAMAAPMPGLSAGAMTVAAEAVRPHLPGAALPRSDGGVD